MNATHPSTVPFGAAAGQHERRTLLGWKSSLHAEPRQAKKFYLAITGFTVIAIGLNFLGPIR
jgi:hypothetical protein